LPAILSEVIDLLARGLSGLVRDQRGGKPPDRHRADTFPAARLLRSEPASRRIVLVATLRGDACQIESGSMTAAQAAFRQG
jgi:hypothetical protein